MSTRITRTRALSPHHTDDSDAAAATFVVDVSAETGRAGESIAGELVYPSTAKEPGPATVLFCLPGYGVSRRYFDLDVPEGGGDYSMARHMAGYGYVSVMLDHLGTGQSTRVPNATLLTAPALAAVHAYAHDRIIERLTRGTLARALAPMSHVRSIGVGHSTGARITVHQQAAHRSHSALVLFGYSGGGRAQSATGERAGSLYGPRVPEQVFEAFRQLRTEGLPEAGRAGGDPAEVLGVIDVPLLCAVGDDDIIGPPHRILADFRGSRDVTLVVVRRSGHNQNLSPSRQQLWDRAAGWLRSLSE